MAFLWQHCSTFPDKTQQIKHLSSSIRARFLLCSVIVSNGLAQKNVGHRQSLHNVLTRCKCKGLIRHAKVPVVGGHQNLWGITEHGQAVAYDPSKNETPSAKVFEPGRISALRLKHVLIPQKDEMGSSANWLERLEKL